MAETIQWMHSGKWSDVHLVAPRQHPCNDPTMSKKSGWTQCGLMFYGWTPRKDVPFVTCPGCMAKMSRKRQAVEKLPEDYSAPNTDDLEVRE